MQDLPQRNQGFLACFVRVDYGWRMNAKVTRLGIYGGTFNPVHHGHLILAREAMELLELDRLLLVPNVRSPLRMGEELASPEQRLELLRLALRDEPGMEASDVEIRRGGPSYTVDTLEAMAGEFPDAERFFLAGADSLDTLDRWVRVERIVELARVVILPRPGCSRTRALAELISRRPELEGTVELLQTDRRVDISATEIRERLAAGKSIRWLVPEAVRETLSPAFSSASAQSPQTSRR